MIKKLNNQRGFATFYVTILILSVVFTVAVSIYVISYGQQKIVQNMGKSSQSEYSAESGIEDALLRLKKNSQMAATSYILNIEDSTASVSISGIIGGARTISSEGNFKNRVRKMEVSYGIDAERVSFRYGAQVGEGGIEMYNKAKIEGNVFSNGSIYVSGAGQGEVTGETIIAATSTVYGNNQLDSIKVGSNAYAYSCLNSDIGGKLYLGGGSAVGCTVTGGTTTSDPIAKLELPITQEQIDGWKNDASSSDIYVGNYVVGSNESFGPRKIVGSLTINNGKTLTMTGTIWVTGTTTLSNNASVTLDQIAYGTKSGVLISDKGIIAENGSKPQGSGLAGSYLMLLSTSDSLSEESPAIYVKNNAQGAIFYADNGLVTLNNNMNVREVTGYKVLIKPNAEVEYETGLIDALFTSGPGGSWKVTSWKEVE